RTRARPGGAPGAMGLSKKAPAVMRLANASPLVVLDRTDSAAIGASCVREELGSRTPDEVDLVLGQAPEGRRLRPPRGQGGKPFRTGVSRQRPRARPGPATPPGGSSGGSPHGAAS